MEQTIHDNKNPTPTEAASQITMQEDVRRLLSTLSPKEQAVIWLRFGLDDGKPRTLADIAKTFHVHKERIRKIESRALLKLRQPYRNDSVKMLHIRPVNNNNNNNNNNNTTKLNHKPFNTKQF